MFGRNGNKTRVRLLRSLPLFATCSLRQLRQVDSLTSDVEVKAGRVLTHFGHPGREFFIVISGTATVWCQGVELDRLGPGSFFGELALMYHQDRAATVVADTDMALLVMSVQEFRSPYFLSGPVKDAIFAVVPERLCRINQVWVSAAEAAMRSELRLLPKPGTEDRPSVALTRDSQMRTLRSLRENVESLRT